MRKRYDNECKINGERVENQGHAKVLNMRERKQKERFKVDS